MRLLFVWLCASFVGAPAVAAPNLWRAAAAGPPPGRPAQVWARIGDARAAQGRYPAAAAAYLAAVADSGGATPAGLSTRLGDVLMAQGELASAEAAYRDAIAAGLSAPALNDREAARLDDPHGRTQEVALACAGLAAALDRAGQPGAARQMVREALAADPTASALEVATLPDSDVRILPEGEVFYRLGLVRLATGRRTDAVAAFHEYLERSPGSRWTDAAQAHVAELESPAGSGPARRAGNGARLLAVATVLSTGGAPAPLIDAAWRSQAAVLDDCLEDAAGLLRGGGPLRIAIEIEIDGRGRVTSAEAKLPVANAGALARCLEDAVRGGLRLPASPRARSTRARTELLLGPP